VARAEPLAAFWTVCPVMPAPGCDYDTIQEAIDEAGDGDVIRVVGNSTYAENLVITKSLTLLGGCANAACTVQAPGIWVTTVDGGGADRTVTISGTIQVALDGFVITGGDATHGTYPYQYGGGVGAWYADLILTRNVITGNVAHTLSGSGYGGGVSAVGGTIDIIGSQVVNNYATLDTGNGHGGGVYLEQVSGVISDTRIQGNAAAEDSQGEGGGINLFNSGPITLSGNTIYGNTAATAAGGSGGGLYIRDCQVVMQENTIVDNLSGLTGTCSGGGMRVRGTDLRMSQNLVVSNTGSIHGTGSGGGMMLTSSDVWLDRDGLQANVATFTTTVAQYQADAIYLAGNAALTATNVVIVRNGVPGYPGSQGIYSHDTAMDPVTITLVNSTIVSNVNYGVRCLGSYSNLVVANSILWGNGDDVDCTTLDLSYSDVEDGDSGTGVIHQDPQFVDPGALDFHLVPGSPCIDVGAGPGTNPLVPDVDWDGDARPIGGGYDIGADEVLLSVFLPTVLRDY